MDTNQENPFRFIIQVLSAIRPVEQHRIPIWDGSLTDAPLPSLAWRFGRGSEDVYAELESCVKAYRGLLRWVVYRATFKGTLVMNYVLEPSYLCKNAELHYTDQWAVFAVANPQLVADTYGDLYGLGGHIARWFGVYHNDCVPLFP